MVLITIHFVTCWIKYDVVHSMWEQRNSKNYHEHRTDDHVNWPNYGRDVWRPGEGGVDPPSSKTDQKRAWARGCGTPTVLPHGYNSMVSNGFCWENAHSLKKTRQTHAHQLWDHLNLHNL